MACPPLLDEYWQNHPELHDIPIYYASSLAKKCMAVYQTYVNAMNDKIRKAININNPFVFKHISNLKVKAAARPSKQCVVFLPVCSLLKMPISRTCLVVFLFSLRLLNWNLGFKKKRKKRLEMDLIFYYKQTQL